MVLTHYYIPFDYHPRVYLIPRTATKLPRQCEILYVPNAMPLFQTAALPYSLPWDVPNVFPSIHDVVMNLRLSCPVINKRL